MWGLPENCWAMVIQWPKFIIKKFNASMSSVGIVDMEVNVKKLTGLKIRIQSLIYPPFLIRFIITPILNKIGE